VNWCGFLSSLSDCKQVVEILGEIVPCAVWGLDA